MSLFSRRRVSHVSVFLGRVTIVLYWFLEIFSLSALRFAYRYFRYTRVRRHARTEGASLALVVGRAADAEVLLRGIESGAVKQIWPIGVLSPSIWRSRPVDPQCSGARRHR